MEDLHLGSGRQMAFKCKRPRIFSCWEKKTQCRAWHTHLCYHLQELLWKKGTEMNKQIIFDAQACSEECVLAHMGQRLSVLTKSRNI